MSSALYSAQNLNPSYQLYFDWTGWFSTENAVPPPEDFWHTLAAAWMPDGLHLLEHRWNAESVHLTFSTNPAVSPVFLAQRAKGRLQHGLRAAGTPVTFSRKVSVRTTGKATRHAVEQYVATQVDKADLADPRYAARLRSQAIVDTTCDLARPAESGSGRYWYNLHLVLVTDGRIRIIADEVPAILRETCVATATRDGHTLSRVSFMPDHIHATFRGNIEYSPERIALTFQNDLATALRRGRILKDTYYVGTFGEYDLGVVRGSG